MTGCLMLGLAKFLVSGRVQAPGRGAHLCQPAIEIRRRGRDGLELLLREALAAVLHIAPGELTRLLGQEVQLGLHPCHGIDLPAEAPV